MMLSASQNSKRLDSSDNSSKRSRRKIKQLAVGAAVNNRPFIQDKGASLFRQKVGQMIFFLFLVILS